MKRITCIALLITMLLAAFSFRSSPVQAAEATIAASSAEIKSLFYSRSNGVHPRLYATEDQFTELKQRIHTDPYLEKWYSNTYKYYGEQHYSDTLIWVRSAAEQASSGKRFNDLFDGIGRIANTAFLYRLTGESRFAECALKDMLWLAEQSSWDYNFLEMAQISYAMGLGYDWLYDYMTAAQRNTICDAIYSKAIEASYTLPSDQVYWKTGSNNLNSWAYGGLTIGALAIFESYPDRCASFLSEMVTNIQNSMRIYAPCGSYPEGPDYSVSGLSFTVYTLEACLSVLGTEFGLSKINGFRESGEYLPAINGYTASFNYGDGGVYTHNTATLFWYANHFRKPELALWQRNLQTHDIYTHDAFFALLWYQPDMLANYTASQAQKDYLLRDDVNYQSVATFRSDADSAQQIYAAIKSGYIRSSHHTDTDIGTFVMDAMGVRWFCDLGSENYSILNNSASGYWDWTESANRWKHYRKRTEGQNTLVINPSTAAGQDTTAKCQISDYQSLADGGYAVIDMTDAYDKYGASSAKRGMLLFDGRSRVLLRDEIVCNSASTVYWFAHTQASISISADGKTATLTQGGKTLLAQIASPSSATFTGMAATPLTALNPNPDGQKSNSAYRKLAIKLTNVKSTQISVVFTPVTSTSAESKTLPTIGISQFSSYLQTASAGSTLPVNANGEYEISTPEHFVKFASMVNSGTSFSGKTVKLLKDLDLQGWTLPPIGGGTTDGTSGKAFAGTFDGGNHVIRNLFLYRPNHYYVALFGSISGATIQNLGVESGRVFGYDKASGLVGMSLNSTVSNCYSKASVNGTGPYHAGLVAQIVLETNIRNCYFTGSVNGTDTTGGLVAYVGSNSTLNMSNCYHAGLLSGSAKYTGMIGFYHTSGSMCATKISVSKCYSTQRLKGTQVAANTAIESYSACGTITDAQMVSAAIYIGGSFMYDCEWENEGYPVLSWQCNTSLPQDGVLSSAAQLRLIAWQVNSGKTTFSGRSFSLANNLDLGGREWIPIGGNTTSAGSSGYAFDGTLDGKGHSIRNLRITVGNCYVGFFGRLTGRVCNLGIQSGTVKGNQMVGGISGCGGNMDRCYNSAGIQGTATVGGVIGTSTNSPTTNCYNTGSVTASGNYAGGIIAFYSGASNGAQLKNCYNIGKISAGTSAGAMVGAVNDSVTTLTIANCHSSSGNALIGGNGSQFLSGCSLMTAAQLKGAASTLGSAYCTDEAGRNLGYPLLTWQIRSDSNATTLYFDFRNDTIAMAKYTEASYGGYNFDLAEHWITENSGSGNGDTLVKIDSAAGVMHVNLSLRDGTNGSNNLTSFEPVGSDKRFAWTTQTDRANELRYAPQQAQALQVRLKLYNTEQLGSYQPRLNLYYLPKGASAWSSTAEESLKECFALMIPTTCLNDGSTEGQYVTLTASLAGTKFTSYEEIRGLHFQFSQLHGGTATIDYIYIGPKSGLPTPQYTVTYKGADGKVLATQTVHKGETAVYPGATPTKAYDATNHYLFKGWDKALTNITANITVTAQFTAAPHGYSYKVTKTPTTSAASALTGTCSSCKGTTTVTLPKLNTTDYSYAVTKAATCAATGTGRYTWKITSYGSFYFDVTIAKTSSHSYNSGVITTQPTCTAAGVKTYTCSVCKGTKTEALAATGHAEVIDKAVAATCIAAGKTEGKHCSVCKAVLVAQQTIPAKGHTEVIDKAVAATCTATGKTEGKHCSVCSAVLVAQQTVPATGHSYIYTKIDALIHRVACKNCDITTETAHSYKDGFCICGEPEVKEPVEDATLKLNHSLNLASDISVNLLVSKTLLEGFDISTVYVESTVDCYEGNRLTGTSTIRRSPVLNGNYYYFTLNGLTAVQMNDSISSVLYGTKNGQPYYSPVDVYSIASYAYSQMNHPDRPEALKTLCADLLRYGAKAQIFKSYRTDALADANLTTAHKAYLSDISAVTFGNTNRVLNDLENAPIAWAGKALDLESKVALKFVFDPANYTGDLSKLTLKVSYTDISGASKTLTLEKPELYNPDRMLYAFTFDALLAAELRTVVSVQIFADSTPLSPTLQYSADTYGNNKVGTLLVLCKSLFAYSDSALAYFK